MPNSMHASQRQRGQRQASNNAADSNRPRHQRGGSSGSHCTSSTPASKASAAVVAASSCHVVPRSILEWSEPSALAAPTKMKNA